MRALLVVIIVAAGCNDGGATPPSTGTEPLSTPLTTPSASVTMTTTRDQTIDSVSTTTTSTSTSVPPSTLPATTAPPLATLPTFGAGAQLVGRDVQPGVYQSAEISDGACYWERLSGSSGDLDEIIVNGTLFGGRALVEIRGSDESFSSSGCGEWVAWLGGPPVEVFGEGDWHVGPQVQPGRYVAALEPDALGCYWERASGFGHDLHEILANANVFAGQAIVDILPGDMRFTSSGCGEWTRLG